MPEMGLQDVASGGGIAALGLASDQRVGFTRRDTEIEDQVLTRQAVDGILEVLNPPKKFGALLGRGASHLMGKIGADIAVHEHHFAFAQRRLELRLGLETVASVEQGGEARVDALQWAEVAIEEFADHLAEPGIVLRETGGINGKPAGSQRMFQKIRL